MYLISKLLLNSLYGRFGMHYETFITQHNVINNSELVDVFDIVQIEDLISLDIDKSLISFINHVDNNKDELSYQQSKF